MGYKRDEDGLLTPHGHGRSASIPVPTAVPSARGTDPQPTPRAAPRDRTAPTIGAMNPAAGATIGTAHTFTANVTDPSGLRSVTFTLTAPNRRTSSYPATAGTDGTYKVPLQGITGGKWSWTVNATDNSGNVQTGNRVAFTVVTTPPLPLGDSSVTANAGWSGGGAVQSAAGRIFFKMPTNAAAQTSWAGYVCSGTVVTDANSGQSVILTAAHCVYDDVHKVFAGNVMFIPDQADTTGADTDTDCSNDRYGCWAPSFGVVDGGWTTATFPDNIPWDYAYTSCPQQVRTTARRRPRSRWRTRSGRCRSGSALRRPTWLAGRRTSRTPSATRSARTRTSCTARRT